jgi:hypothetical protein
MGSRLLKVNKRAPGAAYSREPSWTVTGEGGTNVLRKLITGAVAASTVGGFALLAPTANATIVPTAPTVPAGVHETRAATFDGLTELMIQRIVIGDDVAASKYFSGKPVDDPVREQQILDSVRQVSAAISRSSCPPRPLRSATTWTPCTGRQCGPPQRPPVSPCERARLR